MGYFGHLRPPANRDFSSDCNLSGLGGRGEPAAPLPTRSYSGGADPKYGKGGSLRGDLEKPGSPIATGTLGEPALKLRVYGDVSAVFPKTLPPLRLPERAVWSEAHSTTPPPSLLPLTSVSLTFFPPKL
ncbi:hypothetical protein H1C71_024326 [Ictidomys tridecemlineatus]|nr:hypothetical protein H1C71_024326 [Ictidomys tridecemlineatus]KAG3271534.1 hypothetical protein H1C71_024326 [Ictidomys tridecemlineatus]KAG3271535.1 hypothetical protein H1C71_024326 [Ictidomys tridecemlineatus]KAG3271536.1 hypothetical protein H1C71_024326 [Ictidomys tridecemlineatus]